MARILYQHLSSLRRNQQYIFLGIAIPSGFLLGIHLASQIPFHTSLMHGLFSAPASIVPLVCAALIPFLLSAFAAYYSCKGGLYILAFFRCLFFGFVAWGITCHFAGGGWLARLLTLFHSSLSLPALVFYWFRHIHRDSRFSPGITAAVGVWSVLVPWLEFRFILPVLASI